MLSRSSCTSTTWYGARSTWEYCLAAPTRAEIRVVQSSSSLISSSVSIAQYSQRTASAQRRGLHRRRDCSSQAISSPAATMVGASCQPSSSPCESSHSVMASSVSDASSGEIACASGTRLTAAS